MPSLPPERFAPLSALGLGEKDAWLYETRRHDGLAPTQIVRRWGGPGHGLPETAMAALSARLDAAADADADADAAVLLPALGGPAAYVANPLVEGVPHPGLWRGGPVLVQFDRQSVPKDRFLFLEQTLTLVHHAGGWAAGEGGAVELGACSPATVPRVRPALRDARRPDAPLVADWTGSSGEVEATVRDWTEESRDALLAASPEQLGLPAGWSAAERRFETDPATGTGVLVLRCVRRTVWEISGAADLLRADHRLEPARRETIRNFGLGAPSGGEAPARGRGFAWTRAAEWRDVSRASVPRILGSVDMDGLGRSLLGAAAPAWRTLLRETLPQDDGLVTLRVTWQRPDLDASPREPVATDRSNPAGWGDSARSLVPTVPLSDAPARAAAIAPPAGSVLAGVSVDEREGGSHADIRVQTARVWTYSGDDAPPNLPAWRGLSAPEIEWRPNLCDGRGGVVLVWRRVAREAQDSVVARAMGSGAAAALPGAELRRLRLSGNEDGSEDITAEYSSRLAVAEFSRVVSGDCFANVYRREYDGLSISDAGAAAGRDGAPVRILDALGNEVPTRGVGEHTVLFRPGVRITADFRRDDECRWHVSVTTEVAVPREWEYEYETQRGGHPQAVRVHVWRNWPSSRLASAAHGCSADNRDEINAFGLHDGQAEVRPDVYETSRRTVSASPMERTERTDTLVEGAASANASAQDGKIVTESVTAYSDGKHDHSRTVEEAREKTVKAAWTEKRSGHDISVRMESRHNVRNFTVDAGAGERVGVSASANRFGLVDATVRAETDVYVVGRTSSRESVDETVETEEEVAARASPKAASPAPGRAVETSDAVYSDGRHDTSVTVRAAGAPRSWEWTWPHLYHTKGGWKTGLGHGHGFLNQASPQTRAAPGDNYAGSAHWSRNALGLYDGTITFTPVFAHEWHAVRVRKVPVG